MGSAVEAKRQLVEPDHLRLSLRRQGALLGWARSGLYDQPVGPSAEAVALRRLLDEPYTATPFDGSRWLTAWRRRQGYAVNHQPVGRLLRPRGLEASSRKPRLSPPAADPGSYPYLVRGVKVDRINQVWSAAITDGRLAAGLVYRVAVLDWCSRYVGSWAVSMTMEVAFGVEALDHALRQGQPEISAILILSFDDPELPTVSYGCSDWSARRSRTQRCTSGWLG